MNHLLASGPHLAVVPTLTALAVRHFKHKQGQDGGDAELEPKHPAVKFVLGARNEGDFGEARKHIAPDIEIYTNGLSFSSEHGGPAMVKESIESWRALAPDVRMELSGGRGATSAEAKDRASQADRRDETARSPRRSRPATRDGVPTTTEASKRLREAALTDRVTSRCPQEPHGVPRGHRASVPAAGWFCSTHAVASA